jgi:L,D-transpeptidase ErfK/SrfK
MVTITDQPAHLRRSVTVLLPYVLALLALLLVMLFASGAGASDDDPAAVGRTVVDEVVDYVVKAGETFVTIGRRLGVDPRAIARRNTRWVLAPLSAGTRLVVDVHRVVPGILDRGILVSVAQNRVFLLDVDGSIVSMPAAVGRSTWPTPPGEFYVVHKEVNPTWDVPPSIQDEMRRLGRPVAPRIPPGPENPLGDFWIGLSLPNIGIHGTNAPATVPGYTTHGCIRLQASDIKLLFERVEVGTDGVVIYEPALLTRHDGRIYAEIHRDVYGDRPDALRALQRAADFLGVRDLVDWPRVVEAIRLHEGFAIDVTASST